MIKIELEQGKCSFEPGQDLFLTVAWSSETEPGNIDVELVWHTEGKGTKDIMSVWSQTIPARGVRGSSRLTLPLPDAPYSCSGKYLSILWAIEAVAENGDDVARVDIVVSPTHEPIELQEVAK